MFYSQYGTQPYYNQIVSAGQMGNSQQMMQMQQVPQALQVPQGNNITWVQGEMAAKSYQLPPNTNVLLMDSEDSKFYIKTSDNVGMSTIRRFRFEEIKNDEVATNPAATNYITREEFDLLKKKIDEYESVFAKSLKGGLNDEPNNANA